MSNAYRSHHYVPQWYQKKFLEPASRENVLNYLSLRPASVRDAKGRQHELPSLRRRAIRQCFVEEDLYTLHLGGVSSTELERVLFGDIDRRGRDAVEYWNMFAHPSADGPALTALLHYMSAQKLRTPKGLHWLAGEVGTTDPNEVLRTMVSLRTLYGTIWAESIWQLADADGSATKFIVSDHPVTVYNRECGPRDAKWCRGVNDPDIRLHGTHTLFPLSLNRVLILTNLSWARDPYQSARDWRPNPAFFRNTIFNFFEVQTQRSLSEEEVRQINFILKSRAHRFIAAAREEWLFPEAFVSKSDWARFGHGYLLMPDPRGLYHGGEILLGYGDGSSDAFDVFGRKPWESGFGTDDSLKGRRNTLQRFQGEFARLFGPRRRSRAFGAGRFEPEYDSEEYHNYHLNLEGRARRS